ncbi:MAG: DEAD/DEAH box helicase family protein, partial [Smithellaceae bacterium]|nr:DEAD/DEAH box helicase family protein [Smithellaceae bacterium]
MENFELRQYQKEALDKLDQELKVKQNVLFVAATGAGKTVTICRMINAYYKETGRRFLILVNKQELIMQFHADLMRKTSIPERELTICCAGLKSKYVDGRVTIATVQSFIGMMDSYPGADLIILDEVHGVTVDGEYGKVLNYLKSKKPY